MSVSQIVVLGMMVGMSFLLPVTVHSSSHQPMMCIAYLTSTLPIKYILRHITLLTISMLSSQLSLPNGPSIIPRYYDIALSSHPLPSSPLVFLILQSNPRDPNVSSDNRNDNRVVPRQP
jgi:hypothetical protein